MIVTVVGTGYVGLVVGACLAETGNKVWCADVDQGKIDQLLDGLIPIHEPGLEAIVHRNREAERLGFTTDVAKAVSDADVIFIAVGTPPDEDGSADLQHVLAVAETIGRNMTSEKVVITKSTVPVGTAERVRSTISLLTDKTFHVCSNPEFLKEGSAVGDFMKPDRVVIGADSDFAKTTLEELYEPYVRTGNPLIFMDIQSAELTKYAANAMLASRISFMNQIARVCEEVGADVRLVRKGMGSDPRIGSGFLFPGPGYGGSCFPKDVRALLKTAEAHGLDMPLLRSVEEVNALQKKRLYEKTKSVLGSLSGKRIAVWGLAFKAETDDMRESPAIDFIEAALADGAAVCAHDPVAIENAKMVFGDRIEYASDPYAALQDADALVIITEWLAFRNPDFEKVRDTLNTPVVVDGRNLYSPQRMKDLGFKYVCIGKGDAK